MEENNRIIAEFMEFEQYLIQNKSNGYIIDFKDGNVPYKLCTGSLIFHSNWNWLMEVVEKIEKEFCSTDIHYYHAKKMYSIQFLGFNIEYDNSEYGDDKMKILYDSCVKFINFYNKQKEE